MSWLAYIGPEQILPVAGAGGGVLLILAGIWTFLLVRLRRFFRNPKTWLALSIVALIGILIVVGWNLFQRKMKPVREKVLVLGLDGLDPGLLERWMDEGKLPNFARLRQMGGYARLGTNLPPQSPAAWSTFATGANPGRHGVFGFLRRLPENYYPDLALFGIDRSGMSPRVHHYRQAPAFWEIAAEHGYRCSVMRCPCTFPPDPIPGGEMLSGLGVPDLLGTQGSFSVFTTAAGGGDAPQLSGAVVALESGLDSWATAIPGPRDANAKGAPRSELAIEIVRGGDGVAFVLEDRTRRLGEKEWSEWIPVTFHLSRGATMHGMVRAYLVSARPDLRLYFSPIHFQPERPAFPISHPARFAGDLADRIGPYHTLGQAEDTMALNGGHLDEAAFLEQSYTVLAERRSMLDAMMREERHVSVIVFDTPDRIQHMFWRYLEPDHPAYDAEGAERFGGAIEQVYRVCDEIVGQALGYCDERTTLLVLSDHGFTSFRRAVHVNRWLYEHQYLHLLPGHLPDDTASFFQSVDWARTRAYALGLNGIYINRKGREGQGLVAPGRETEALKQEIKEQLSLAVDPETGERMIETVYTQQEAWWGDALEGAPDLVIGYRRGYRGSWKNALGGVPERLVEDNRAKWSGDHCVDPSLVPGILLSNRRIGKADPSLMDLAPTVLQLLSIPVPQEMDGTPLWQ